MNFKQITAVILLFGLFLNLLILSAQAQDEGKPIKITFGQPNIWSLEQAHYLLSQMRERSLGIKAKTLTDLDPNDVNAVRLNLIRQLFGISGEFRQMPSLENPASSPQPTPTPLGTPIPFPSPITEPSPFSGTVLSELLKDKDFLKKLFGDAKLNSTTQLDNHIQLQYEIISKQLTLLRDEVGPDERLIFLELPQSIFATPGKADNKVVQVYWQASSYRTINKVEYLRAKIKEIEDVVGTVADLEKEVGTEKVVGTLEKIFDDAERKFNASKKDTDTKCTAAATIAATEDAAPAAKDAAAAACKAAKKISEKDEKDFAKAKQAFERKKRIKEDLEKLHEDLNNNVLKSIEERIERLKQGGMVEDETTSAIKNAQLANSKNKNQKNKAYETSATTEGEIYKYSTNEDSKVRTIDIIPRQSSLNVNDIQETTKSTILSGAFSFLFGLGLRTNYQRQQDMYEQYIHQELYASGFGKGENTFGWTFGAVPGTKRIAPGIRTTYAVMVVPRDAESIKLNARGCYFPRKNYQPENPMTIRRPTDGDGEWWEDRKRECEDLESFNIKIPNGGDAQGFWLTAMDYSPVKKGNQRMVASINGRNFTQQVGVLVDGVPLQQVVELTRKLPDRNLLDDFCRNGICGAYEVIDSSEITIVFQMTEDYKGTPEITVVGPGRSVSVNRLKLTRIQAGGDEFFDKRLTDDAVPLMFGSRVKEALAVHELQILSQAAPGGTITALLTGTKFEKSSFEEVSVNGVPIAAPAFLSSENYKLTFSPVNTDSYTVMVRRCRDKNKKLKDLTLCDTSDAVKDSYEVAVKSFPIAAAQFGVTNSAALSYDREKDVMFVRIEGTGLGKAALKKVNGNDPLAGSGQIPISAREILIKIIKPEAVVKITLVNPDGKEINVVVVRPIDETETSDG